MSDRPYFFNPIISVLTLSARLSGCSDSQGQANAQTAGPSAASTTVSTPQGDFRSSITFSNQNAGRVDKAIRCNHIEHAVSVEVSKREAVRPSPRRKGGPCAESPISFSNEDAGRVGGSVRRNHIEHPVFV